MDRQTLRSIIFESRQMHKSNRTVNKRFELGYQRNQPYNNRQGSICLLGSLQLQQKTLFETPSIKNFQIVQLKKQKASIPKKQESKYDTALKTQIKNREIQNHRQTFKVNKIEHAQLGTFEKSFIQNPNYFRQDEAIKNSRSKQKGRKSQRNADFSHGKSSLNIQLLPEKFIPSQLLTEKEYRKIYDGERRKIIEERNQSIKKSLYLDFKYINFNICEAKQLEKSRQTSPHSANQKLTFPPSESISRTTSMTMTSIPRKQYLKKLVDQQKQFQDKLQTEKKYALEIRKEVNKNYAKPFNPPENVTAQAFIVYQITKKQSKYKKSFQSSGQKKKFQNGHKVIVQLNSRSPLEMASLTKIMTFITALQISAKYSKDPLEQIIKIGMFEQNITGTSANLFKGQIYRLEQLFYGLMLPSGNDASLAIAVWGGKVLLQNTQIAIIDAEPSLLKRKKIFYDRFLEEMNKKAAEIGMQKTHYANSHGLMNCQNKSCAFDLAILCEYAMKNKKFRQVVKTQTYECTIEAEKQDFSTTASPTLSNRSSSVNLEAQYFSEMKDFNADQKELFQIQEQKQFEPDDPESNLSESTKTEKQTEKKFSKKIYWENTHLLLQQKSNLYSGIKTGITNAAGPCLASMVEYKQRQFIIVVLNCRSMKQRFKDTQNLRKWTFDKEEIKVAE